ncbi:hypothetical protein [Tenacibaculum bernardetii]|uniref:hypothetical protein n=1 Tax=Tenacibaculum bernardetii TaxID=3021375 RepID=UPI0023B104BB|nr:hypothetical protein [Tenacibaculum bernardetii]
MDKKKYIHVLKKPSAISQEISTELKNVIQQYPYFQSARTLELKTLKNKDSFKYNNELKITAAYTTDRSVLFDFITSKSFKEISNLKEKKASLKEILLPNKKETTNIEKDLAIGKPLAFTKSESFSFNQWLQLSSKNVITRDAISSKKEVITPINLEKNAIIDRFIEKSPKISRPSKTNPSEIKTTLSKQNSQLATETLAKVYLEQKKYESAIQAYKILSLKYPEKSGFFADQIKRIQILQKNK